MVNECLLSIGLLCFIEQCFSHIHPSFDASELYDDLEEGALRSGDLLKGTELWKAEHRLHWNQLPVGTEHAYGCWVGPCKPASPSAP